ncbi:MAG: DNA alkylation repair protein [Clostridia bacterium]|nr:DNA alkylation repair protein [Clostridia bacterium]
MSELSEEIRKLLLEKQDIKYRDFSKSLCLTSKNEMIGVRTPLIREIAKKFEVENIEKYIFDKDIKYYEELLLRGVLIGNKNNSLEDTFKYLKYYIPLIDSWGICDGTCASIKITNKNIDEMWNFLQNYIKSDKEYEIRFAVVMYLDYYTKTKYLKKIFKQIEQLKNDEYYVKMGVAWFIAEAYINNREDTLDFLKNTKIDNWTYNKGIQKIRESLRATPEEKNMLNKMKRK